MSKRLVTAVLALAVIAAIPSTASAQGVEFNGVGSAAFFNTFAVAAFSDVCSARPGSDCHHWSIKGTTPAGTNWAQGVDSRSPSNPIPNEQGSLWVVWDQSTSPATVWAYLSVDAIVGNRMFFASPRATLQIDPTANAKAGANLVVAAILLNRQTNLAQADEACLPDGTATCIVNGKTPSVLSVIQTAFTAALTTIRPEDAKFATTRALAAYNAKTLNGLGYGNGAAANCNAVGYTVNKNLGCPFVSVWSASSKTTPVQFSLPGKKDPFTNLKVPKAATIAVGASPLVFLYNATNAAGLGAQNGGLPIFQDITYTIAGEVWNGTQGSANFLNASLANVPLSIIQQEPTAGTTNVAEYSTFRVFPGSGKPAPKNSQETGIDITQPNTNPLNLPTQNGGGVRLRAIATSQMVSGSGGVGGILHLKDSVGYVLFSYGNVAPIAGSTGAGRYVTLDGVDPINSGYTSGQLPTCTAPCPIAPGTSFPHLRDGSYRAWTTLLVITDAAGSNNYLNAQAIVTAAQNEVNATVPDFVSAVPTADGDPGLLYYQSHYAIPGIAPAPNNGFSGTESGGEVGGCPFLLPAAGGVDQTNRRLNETGVSPNPCPVL